MHIFVKCTYMETGHCNCIQNLDVMLHIFFLRSHICNQRNRIKSKTLVFFYFTTFFNQEIVCFCGGFSSTNNTHIDLELAYGLFEILRRYNACPSTVVYPHPREIRSWCNHEYWHDLRLHMHASF